MRYNLYYAPDGCDEEYVGEYASLEEASVAAAAGKRGLEKSLWDTARAAGHCGGLYAPETMNETEDAYEWLSEFHVAVPLRE